MWDFGLPSDRDVWESTEYSERDFAYDIDSMVIEAKGEEARWNALALRRGFRRVGVLSRC